MSSSAVDDYLTKQIFIEKNIVTYRSLSRELRLHVNAAKNELAVFHENAPYHSLTSHATYLLCGEVEGSSVAGSQDSYVDYGTGEDPEGKFEDDGDKVQQIKFVLVNESDLEDAKTQFTRLSTIHIYSLAPSPLRDEDLICEPTGIVRAADQGKQAKEMVAIVGKVVSLGIEALYVPKKPRSARQNVAGPSRLRPAPLSKQLEAAATTAAVESTIKKEETESGPNKVKDRPKPTGKLGFFSKTKDKAKEKEKEKEPEEAPEGKQAKLFFNPTRRGTKRKSEVSAPEQGEGGTAPATAAPESPAQRSQSPPKEKEKVRLQRRTVLSDDDDNDTDETPKKSTRKPRQSRASSVDSNMEDLQAMMDIDDDQVVRVTRELAISRKKEGADEKEAEEDREGESPDADGDDGMLNDTLSKPVAKPRKRREKKVIPRGRNGLKKRRVVKSRSKMDEKGYMVFEDYSEYESVEEEEEEPKSKTVKGKRKAKQTKEEEDGEHSAAPDPAPKTKLAAKSASSKSAKSGKSGVGQKQGNLANFFTAKSK